MKPAFQKDETFLDDVREAIRAGRRRIWWLGQSGFLLVQGGRGIVLDPYLSDSLTQKYAATDKPHVRLTERVVNPAALGRLGIIDLITSSHAHTDHFDAETLLPLFAANPEARLVLPAANRDLALERLGSIVGNRLVEIDDQQSVRVREIEATGIAAAHPTVERDGQNRCRFLGYAIRWGGFTVYHSGDTMLHPQLLPSFKNSHIDLALLPINGDLPQRRVAGNLDGPEAARLAHNIGSACVIPCHYDMFEFNTASPNDFVEECRRLGQNYKVVRNGEGADF